MAGNARLGLKLDTALVSGAEIFGLNGREHPLGIDLSTTNTQDSPTKPRESWVFLCYVRRWLTVRTPIYRAKAYIILLFSQQVSLLSFPELIPK
jgi:hypothetical protein